MLAPTLLLFNLSGPAGDALKALCRRHGLRWTEVAPGDFGRPLGALVGLPAKAAAGPAAPVMPFQGPMLVMANLTRPQFDALLEDMRAQGVRVPLKAVLTPVNVGWNALRLHDELLREHEELRKRGGIT